MVPAMQINVSPERESLYREALGRLRPRGGFAGLITSHPAEAAAANVPCLLDRPDAQDLAQLGDLLDSNKPIMPAHPLRFLPEIVPIRESAAAGKLGMPGLLRVHVWINDALPAEQLAFDQIDLAICLFDAQPNLVHCLRRPNYLQLHLGFPGDAMALIDIATQRPGPDPYLSVHLIGSDGAVYADYHRNAQLLFTGGGTRALVHQASLVLATQKMLEEFISGDWQVGLADTIAAKRCLQEGGLANG